MHDQLAELERDALAEIDAANDLAAIDEAATKVLGKSAAINKANRQLGSLPQEDRKEMGRLINETRQNIQNALEAKTAIVRDEVWQRRLAEERRDLTEIRPNRQLGHAHIVTQAWMDLEDVFVGMGYEVAEGPEVETDWYNFDALNIPPGHPARDGFDTIYVDYGTPGSTLLRTHTSPVQIRAMQAKEPPIYIVAPGRVFRRDTADATHMPVFHQIEGLVIDKGISLADLAGTIQAFTTTYFGEGFSSRLRPNHFPFTEPSAEFDIQRPDGSWLEMGGCGMVHPNVLRAGGIDPEVWSGFAFGFGIDRLALMKFGVEDLRDIFTNDFRFISQF